MQNLLRSHYEKIPLLRAYFFGDTEQLNWAQRATFGSEIDISAVKSGRRFHADRVQFDLRELIYRGALNVSA